MASTKGKPLTADLVVSKTKSDSLHNIKNLNLWGNDLEDLKLLREMTNLEVVSLSVNRISSLKEFSSLHKLQELYLRKNNIQDINEIKYLARLPELKVLWLHDNPCANIEHYRATVIRNLPNLVKLDNALITREEKEASRNVPISDNDEDQYEPPKSNKKVESPYKEPYKEPTRESDKIGGGGGNYLKYEVDNRPLNNGSNRQDYLQRPMTGGGGSGYRPEPDSRPLNVNNRRDDPDSRPLGAARPTTSNPSVRSGINKWEQRQNNSRNDQLLPSKKQLNYREKQTVVQTPPPPPAPQQPHSRRSDTDEQEYGNLERNKNILMAVVSLLRELDENSLEVVKGEVDKLLSRR